VDVCHFVQVVDRNGEVRIFGTEDGPETLTRRQNGILVVDNEPPVIQCGVDQAVGTDSDGGDDCRVSLTTHATASDMAGGFDLTNDYNPDDLTRSAGIAVGSTETAFQTASANVVAGSPVTVTFTVTDDGGSTASCPVTLTVDDDTVPQVSCQLIEQDQGGGGGGGGGGGPGTGGPPGQGPGGNGPPGQGGNNPPGQQDGRFFIVDYAATDNCSAANSLSFTAEIDTIEVSLGQEVKITTGSQGQSPTAAIEGGVLHIRTPFSGQLTVTATDLEGNVGQCETPPLR
jgi:hypothetical protein